MLVGCGAFMSPEKPRLNPHMDELTSLEDSLRKRAHTSRLIVLVVLVVACGAVAWFSGQLVSFGPPEAEPLERVLTEPFLDLQLSWFETLTTQARMNEELQASYIKQFNKDAAIFLAEVAEVEPQLVPAFKALTESMAKFDQLTFLIEDGQQDVKQVVAGLNTQLAEYEPRFVLDVEPFDGLIDNKYVTSVMIFVYEVLDTRSFVTGHEPPETVDLLVVRRRDALPTDPYQHGYVRRSDASAAFVLQDNSTSFVARFLFPSFKSRDAAFKRRFDGRVPDELLSPYGVLVELAQLELKSVVSASATKIEEVAEDVAKREKIYERLALRAEGMGIRIRKPDGLLWPRSFTHKVLMENTAVNRRGEALLMDSDMNSLLEIAGRLDDQESLTMLHQVSSLITDSVAFHEARHVLDVRNEREASDCIRERIRITDDDEDFWRTVDYETRAYLTQIIEHPPTLRLSLLGLLNHLYHRSGTAYFYTARTILRPLAFAEDETDIPGGWAYVEQLTMRLASLDGDTVRKRAEEFYEECFGTYQPLKLNHPDNKEASGCGISF